MFKEQLEQAKNKTSATLSKLTDSPVKKYLSALREQQEQLLSELPPTRKDEEWKYVDLKFLDTQKFAMANPPATNAIEVSAERVLISIFSGGENTNWKTTGTLPKGLHIFNREQFSKYQKTAVVEGVLGANWSYNNYFSKLNQCFDGCNIYIVIAREFNPSLRIECLFAAAEPAVAQMFNTHAAVVVEAQAEATILEKTVLRPRAFLNAGIDYFLAEGARLKVLKVEKGEESGWGCHTSRYSLKKDATLFSTTATIGSPWSRHNAYVELAAEGAQADMLATYLAEDEQFVDHHTTIEHKAGATTSLQKYTGVLSDKAKAVFNGRVKIDRYAQKSSAVQINRNLLLSKTAEINTKPELQIDADDVQAKHGATVGQINPEEVFYLTSRGIPEKTARTMLTKGFIEEIGLLQPESLKKIFFEEVGGFLHKMEEV